MPDWDPNALGENTQQELDAGLFKMTIGWDTRRFESKLGHLASVVIPHMGVAMEEIAKKAFDIVARRTPKAKPGHTNVRELWQMQYNRQETIQEYIISNLYPNQDILWYMEEGTRAHVIKPKGDWMLHWEDAQTGEEIYARVVRHPGTKAFHMIRQAQTITQPLIQDYINMTFQQVADMGSF